MLIKDFAELCSVSVRTLHYYDEIGLLEPSFADRYTGYRYYDEKSLLRMQEIMFYRELDFPLKSIKEILSSPDYNKKQALTEQKKLLIMKKERLERLISSIDSAEKGKIIMKAFDNSEFEKYKNEAKERWGNTDAYKENQEKTKGYSKNDFDALGEGMERIMGEFSLCMKKSFAPESEEAQSLVRNLQKYITDNFYTCTKEILAGLGQMYVLDERFKNNIDRHGDGTAQFISDAVAFYCR
ncbi:MAG: MerR family transcriptional regulator [Clostridia bacterium]|nr:MerR family transcriptional regulator [Clostridia bacterium]